MQAWVCVSSSPLESSIATSIARRLAYLYQGDLASADWRHLGRLAGFTNQKPERRTIYDSAPWVKVVHARAVLAPAGEALIEAARHAWRCDFQHSPTCPDLGIGHLIDAKQAHYIYQRLLSRWRVAQRFARPDWSIVDLWVARHLLSVGWRPGCVQQIIRLASPQFPRRHGDASDYLRRTLDRAVFSFPPQGGPV
jgi:hypothetical protein